MEEITSFSVRMLLIGRDRKMKFEEMCETDLIGKDVSLSEDACKSKMR